MNEKKEKIISLTREKGPILPSDVSGEIGLSLLITSAMCSELVDDKTFMISHLKVGGSPLYFLPEQKSQLERFINKLYPKERQVFEMLKKGKLIEDEKLGHAEKIAIRNIRDFAIPLKVSYSGEDHIFWRLYSENKESVMEKIRGIVKKELSKRKPLKVSTQIKQKRPEKQERFQKPEKKFKPQKQRQQRPIRDIPQTIPKTNVQKAPKISAKALAFKKRILDYAKSRKIFILSEKTIKNNDITLLGSIKSDLGLLQYLVVGKDKKVVNEGDLSLAYNKGQSMNLPVLFISTGKLTKKGKNYSESLKGQLIFRRMKY